ncbi:MAG: hypothetical protein ACI9HG_000400 [Flavobacteriales bacterium]|jgi:hypothetical protein
MVAFGQMKTPPYLREMAHDWNIFTKRISVHASLTEIYRVWTTETGLISWFFFCELQHSLKIKGLKNQTSSIGKEICFYGNGLVIATMCRRNERFYRPSINWTDHL